MAFLAVALACADRVAGPPIAGCLMGPCAAGPLPFDSIAVLALPTFDRTGQVVHPDEVAVPPGWSTFSRYLAITTYPNGNGRDEFPSVFAATNGRTWVVPVGAPNPVIGSAAGVLSDPDQLYVPEFRELWLYYRVVTSSNLIYFIHSADGVHWSDPVLVVEVPNHLLLSPAVVHRGPDDWWMWSVNGGRAGCSGPSTTVELRRSSDGRRWSAPQVVGLRQPGFYPWHLDVEWIASRHTFWALYNGKTPGSCATAALFLATSADGITWTSYRAPLLVRGVIAAFRDIVYRSSFEYDSAADAITFWFSGARLDGWHYVWSAAIQRRRRADVFAQIARTPVAVPAPRVSTALLELGVGP